MRRSSSALKGPPWTVERALPNALSLVLLEETASIMAVLLCCLPPSRRQHFPLLLAARGFGFAGLLFDATAAGREPFLQQTEADGQQSRPEKDADESERQRPTEHAEEDQDERHVAALADEPGFDHVVHAAHADAPDQHEDAQTSGA